MFFIYHNNLYKFLSITYGLYIQNNTTTCMFLHIYLLVVHIFIVQRIDLGVRSKRYIKIDNMINRDTKKAAMEYGTGEDQLKIEKNGGGDRGKG